MKRGFTLVELLVVVLIIGILAAVALPQYNRAVEKSRATEAKQMLANIATAYRAYQMENGSDPTTFADLDLVFIDENGNKASAPTFYSKNFVYQIGNGGMANWMNCNDGTYTISAQRRNDNNKYVVMRCPNKDLTFCQDTLSGLVSGSCKKAGFSTNSGNCLSDYVCWTD